MNYIRFIWDGNKNELNKAKHKLSFEEAKEVFEDENGILFDDPDHSYEEDRFLIIGSIKSSKICIVSHCYKDSENVIRINISKRGNKERKENIFGGVSAMREEYDINNLNPRKNPYAKKVKKQITINISTEAIEYFKSQSAKNGIPYQTLIDLYLVDCANNKKTLNLSWN